MRPTPDEIRAHTARWPAANGGGLWRQRLYGTTHHPVRLLEIQPGHEDGTPLAFDERTEWTPCTPDGDPVHLVEERDYYRDQHDKMRAHCDDLAAQLARCRSKCDQIAAFSAQSMERMRRREQEIEAIRVALSVVVREGDELQRKVNDIVSQLAALRQKLGNVM